MLHSWNLHVTAGDPVRPSTGRHVAGSEEQNRETLYQRRALQGGRQPRILSFQKKEHIHSITWLIKKTSDLGASI